MVGDWLSGFLISWHSKLQPSGETQQVTPDVNRAVPSLAVFGIVWQEVQLGAWL